jgi:acyl-CoA thioesterase-1
MFMPGGRAGCVPGIVFARPSDVRVFLIGLVIAATSIACKENASPTAPDSRTPVIVAFGDSLTSGPGLRPEQTYPALLQDRIADSGHDQRVINAGVSGDTSSEALRRFDASLVPGAEILILAIGINDGLRGVPVPTVERNIATMIERAQARGIKVLLCAMEAPPVGGLNYTIEFHRMFSRLSDRYNVPLVPFFLLNIVGNDGWDLDDTLHPTASGHRVIADTIWPYLRPML